MQTTSDSGPRRAVRQRTERYLHLAALVDLLHMPLVIGLVVLGATAWRGPVFYGVVSAVVVVQVGLLGCPCMLLSGWLRRKHDPTHVTRWSFTAWLYQRYGPWAGIGVFVLFALAALALRAVLV